MKLLQIPPDITDQVWGAVEPFLKRAALYSGGTSDPSADRERIKNNFAQLWVIVEDESPHKIVAAGLTSITEYPNGTRALMIELLSGEEHSMNLWAGLKAILEEWALQNGCFKSCCWARKGWAKRLPDYRLTHYILEKTLAA